MTTEKAEGLVLRTLDYKDRQKIITLFTPTRGLISLIIKGITRKKSHLLTLSSPFTQGEYHFHIGRSELYTFKDGTPLATHHNLRSDLSLIETAATMAKALLLTQLPGKSTPALYALILAYLKELPNFNPNILSSSFHLKLLKHDGLLSLSPHCAVCNQKPTHLFLCEPYCQLHAPSRSHPFDESEWETLITLTEARSFAALKKRSLSEALHQKISNLVLEKIKCERGDSNPHEVSLTTPSR